MSTCTSKEISFLKDYRKNIIDLELELYKINLNLLIGRIERTPNVVAHKNSITHQITVYKLMIKLIKEDLLILSRA
jgi:hypothetical protein